MRKPYLIWRPVILMATGLLAVLASCKQETDENLKPSLNLPLVYDSVGFTYHSQALRPLLNQYMALVHEAEKGRQSGTYVSEEALNAAFTQGDFILQTITTPYYASRLQAQQNGFFAELSKASTGRFHPFDRSWEGGVYGNYLFDEYGLEVQQMIEKGMYGATLFSYAMSLTRGAMSPATADQILYLYGANPVFINSDNAAVYASADRLTAAYAAQRDDATGTGLYSQNRQAFIQLKTALDLGEDYNSYRDEALAAIKLNWEKITAAAVIHKLHESGVKLQSDGLNDQERAEILHWISEAAGFLHGWRTIDSQHKQISDSQIDELLGLLNAPYDQSAAVYRFITNTRQELPKLTEAVARLQGIYGFTNEEVENFRRNYVADQGR
ncbi:hypothetical protein GCM10027299_11640 [Larkinella ripae]